MAKFYTNENLRRRVVDALRQLGMMSLHLMKQVMQINLFQMMKF